MGSNSGGGGSARWLREGPSVGGSTMGRNGSRNQWERTVSENTFNAAIYGATNCATKVTSGEQISQRMIEAFKNPQSLFSNVKTNTSTATHGYDVSNESGDRHMEERESVVCDVAEIEKKR